MWAFFALALVAVAVCIILLLRRYAAPSVVFVVKATTAYAWLVAFVVVVRAPPTNAAYTADGSSRPLSSTACSVQLPLGRGGWRCCRHARCRVQLVQCCPPHPRRCRGRAVPPQVLVPIDVFSTLNRKADNIAVDVMWKTCFWSTQARMRSAR
jgi:hypothetical protein